MLLCVIISGCVADDLHNMDEMKNFFLRNTATAALPY